MSMDKGVFGKKSYEYVIGAIKATNRPALNEEQWNRLREASLSSAEKLLSEFGYPSVLENENIGDTIEQGLAQDVDFIFSLAPDEELTNLLFFENDALNLKLLLKAKLLGQSSDELHLIKGSYPTELLRICVDTDEYSLLGEVMQSALDGIGEETDPFIVSCRVDRAVFANALHMAEKKKCHPLSMFLTEFGIGRNRLTALRLSRLEMNKYSEDLILLPVDALEYKESDSHKSAAEVMVDVNRRMENLLHDFGYDSGMGIIIGYYFTKKNEAAELRNLFAEKSLSDTGGVRR